MTHNEVFAPDSGFQLDGPIVYPREINERRRSYLLLCLATSSALYFTIPNEIPELLEASM